MSHDKTTYTQAQLDSLNKALLHLNISLELFYSYILKPSIMNPQQIDSGYDNIINFIEEVLPCYQTAAFEETINFLKRNKDKILAFTHYLQHKFVEAYPPFKAHGVAFNDFWLTIASLQYNRKNKQRIAIMRQLEQKYGADLLDAMCLATRAILSKLKLTEP